MELIVMNFAITHTITRLHKNTAQFLPFDRLSDLSLKTRWVALVQGNFSPAKQTAADKN